MPPIPLKSRIAAAAILALAGLTNLIMAGPVPAGDADADAAASEPAFTFLRRPNRVALVLPAGHRVSTLNATGETVLTEWHTIWRPICGSAPTTGAAVEHELLRVALAWNAALEARDDLSPPSLPGESDHAETSADKSGGIAGNTFNLVFDIDASVPNEADDAIAAVEAAIEALFADDITVTVNVSFDNLSPGTLGVTSSSLTYISYNASRNGLQNDADDTDGLLQRLPSGSKLPVRYNGNNHTITLENRIFWSLANYKAAIGSIGGDAGSITLNDNVTWDYDPSDGVTGYSFQDVLAHEVGHALGFTSGAAFRDKDMEVMDLFRFQRSDGSHDYNPDSWTEFQTTPRFVSEGAPVDQHITDLIQHTFRMSDGVTYQASHFREQSPSLGQMDPALGWGATRWPDFFSSRDLRVFDAIGWDR